MQIEIWKDIPNYEGLYQVSNLGRVKSLKRNIIMKAHNTKRGYKRIKLCGGGEKKFFVHRLVMSAFEGSSELQVNHINGIKTDNRLENLEYCTCIENFYHAKNTGLTNKGEKHYACILTETDIPKIRKMIKEGITYKKIGEYFGVSKGAINAIKRRRSWGHIK